jgi:signal transduction histidine kinase
VTVRIGLRPRILLLTVLPPVALAVATVWIVNQNVSREVHSSVHEDLRRSSMVFESTLEARTEALATAGQVIARDPRFFSILTLPGSHTDPQFRATVQGVARDFNNITRADLFEVVDGRGRLLATVGRGSSSRASRDPLVRPALEGRATSDILVERQADYQLTVTPVFAHGRVIGALLLGARIGQPLARRLRDLTRSEVTFVSGRRSIGTTLEDGDRDALLQALRERTRTRADSLAQSEVLVVKAPSQTYLTLVRPIPDASPAARQFYVMQRSLEAETAYLTSMRNLLIQLGIVAVVIAVLGGMAVAQRITAPIQRLVRGADEMERGDYQYPLEIKSRDEIGHLAERFEEMRQREKVYVRSLEEVARIKSEFINVASHELRTPISIIRGFHDLFATGGLGPITPAQTRALEAIESSLMSLTRVAEDATKMAQIEGERLVLTIDDYDVASVLRQGVADAMTDARRRELDIEVDVEPGLPPSRMDGMRIAQAVSQLVRNSIRFTPDGGLIEVRAWREEGDLVIQVRDTGIGIPEDKCRDLFDRSFMVRDSLHHHSSSTLEFKSAGLGLGLAIVRGILEAHSGTITVESKVSRGTTFTMRLPLESSPGLQSAA